MKMKMKTLLKGTVAAVGVALLPAVALAQDVVAATTTVNLDELAVWGVTVIGGAVLGLVGVAVHYVAKKFKLEGEAQIRDYVLKAAETGLAIGIEKVGGLTKGRLHIDVKNQAVAAGAQYLADQVPQGLAKLGIDQAGARRIVEGMAAKWFPTDSADKPAA